MLLGAAAALAPVAAAPVAAAELAAAFWSALLAGGAVETALDDAGAADELELKLVELLEGVAGAAVVDDGVVEL